ncbi:hypothetical protein M2132_002490 [Dysgonomonas sp. PH5-45]|uniref:hypothetical protein n=1 Tax=unclassified Dysgonomonas TaxID=2630389 RepID=UPI002474675E|nr:MULTISPECIES: hypothetical protein [unclassified Dysgonomonas]MDH6356127.1 hypothetical protein [Dysgonomonas sp. PH5-45]MDH6389021.1 hypothetical protein [Dysgonomonas sp. PH5-37]
MIDGVKCSCFGLDAGLWQNNPLLDFGLSVSESTGELLTQRREAKAKDLRFVLSPINGGGLSCSFAGSLRKYKNIDGNNHNDFTFSELSNALDSLNFKGKSTIFKIIKFCLTGRNSIKSAIKNWFDDIFLEFSLAETTYTVHIDASAYHVNCSLYRFGIEKYNQLIMRISI